jgi:hypothetical protein
LYYQNCPFDLSGKEVICSFTIDLIQMTQEKRPLVSLTGQIVIEGVEYGQFDEAEVEANPYEEEPVITKKKTRKGYSREKALINLPEEDRVLKEIKSVKLMEIIYTMQERSICVVKLNISLQS